MQRLKFVSLSKSKKTSSKKLSVELVSFAFKKNSLPNSNYLFDVRFLKNPFYVEKLRTLTGLDKEVIDFFEKDDDTCNFLEALYLWVEYILIINASASPEKITLSTGCTGGQHRSPYIIECLAKHLIGKKLVTDLTIYHTELNKNSVSISE